MKNKIVLIITLFGMHILTTSSSGGGGTIMEKERVSFPMMNMEIRHSMEENDRQKEIRKQQIQNSSIETINNKEWKKLQEVKTEIQNKLRITSFALQAIPAGYTVMQSSQRIIQTQKNIIKEIQDAPYAVIPFLPQEIKYIDDMQMNVRLMTGIVVSYGAINQMEKGDRKILLDFALEEMDRLDKESSFTLFLIRDFKEKIRFKKAVMQYYYNRDKEVITDILNNIKTFKN